METWAYDMKTYQPNRKGQMEYRNDLRWASENGWELVSLVPISDTGMVAGMTTELWATFKKRVPAQPQP